MGGGGASTWGFSEGDDVNFDFVNYVNCYMAEPTQHDKAVYPQLKERNWKGEIEALSDVIMITKKDSGNVSD